MSFPHHFPLQPVHSLSDRFQQITKEILWLGKLISPSEQQAESVASAIEKVKGYLESNQHLLQDPKIINDLLEIEYKTEFLGHSTPVKKLILNHFNSSNLFVIKGAGKELLLPRSLLVKKSLYFKNLLSNHLSVFEENVNGKIKLKEDTEEQVLALFEFLCTNHCSLDGDNIASVLAMADKYKIEPIREQCETWLLAHLPETLEESGDFLELADQHQLPRLLESIIKQAISLYLKNPTGQIISLIQKRGKALKTLDCTNQTHLTLDQFRFLLDHCPNLTALNLKDCEQVDNLFVSEIIKLKHLNELDLSSCQINDAAIELIATTFPNLTKLNLNNCNQLTDQAIMALAKYCPNLTDLNLSECPKLTDESIKALAQHCSRLINLDLSDCSELTDESIMEVAKYCPNLTDLNLNGCSKLTDESIKALAQHCSRLINLGLGDCSELTDESIMEVAKYCPNLTDLNLSCCSKLTDESIKALAQHCPRLINLGLWSCSELTDESIMQLAKYCPLLTHLSLVDCSKLTDKAIMELAQYCPNLTYLLLSGCSKLTDESIEALAKHCLHLTDLSLSGCSKLTDQAIMALALHCPNLMYLSLSGCSELTDKAIMELVQHCLDLINVDLDGCSKLTDDAINVIKQLSR